MIVVVVVEDFRLYKLTMNESYMQDYKNLYLISLTETSTSHALAIYKDVFLTVEFCC